MFEQCVVYRLGLMAYEEAWQLQNKLAAEIADRRHPPALLLLEHPHTYTFGRRGKPENLLWDDAELSARGINVYWVDRGGDVTYHGPGQLVGYPLLPLAPLKKQGGLPGEGESNNHHLPQADYVGYVRKLEGVLIRALMGLGVASRQVNGLTGVWVQPNALSRCISCNPELHRSPAKIAAIGVKVDVEGVSRHGFALNVSPNMEYWDGIVGCGLKEYPVVSLADLLFPPPDMDAVIDKIIAAFGEVFKCQVTISTVGPKYATSE